jgi:cytochrome oxidase Cu insertion factor (SCO1/SenC/PrrC family)
MHPRGEPTVRLGASPPISTVRSIAAVTLASVLLLLLGGASLSVADAQAPAEQAADDPHAMHRAKPDAGGDQPAAVVGRQQVLAPGYGALDFDAPKPGTYHLPSLGEAGDGPVLLDDGEASTLHALMADQFVVLSFIYTRCPDANGCPLATHVLRRLERRVSESAPLASRVRFLSLSFDPAHDTPAVMREYAERAAQGRLDWRFLTTRSQAALDPILKAYDQSVIRAVDEHGNPVGSFSHILRVFLIDQDRRIRNIYSVPFLHPDLLISDLATLALECDSQIERRCG